VIVTIHQPEHMPWPGFFHKMAQADRYILLDNVQFKTGNWQNRNRIVTREGSVSFLTVPVLTKGHTSGIIRDIKINNVEKWQKKYWGKVREAYCKFPFWKEYQDELGGIVQDFYEKLFDINMALICFFREKLRITTPMLTASELYPEGRRTKLLVDLCKRCGATRYISGPDGRNYMDMACWQEAGIEVIFHAFSPPTYEAAHYVPGLSTLDILMRFGPESAAIIGLDMTHA
jgi:hypothetical protein